MSDGFRLKKAAAQYSDLGAGGQRACLFCLAMQNRWLLLVGRWSIGLQSDKIGVRQREIQQPERGVSILVH